MNHFKRHLGVREKSELIGKMKQFHSQCLKAKGQVGVYSEAWDALDDLLRKMDSTAEILTGDRRFLYIASAYQERRPIPEKVIAQS